MAEKIEDISLLSDKTRVATPFIKVVIGDYTFGVYDKKTGTAGQAQAANITFPNYIQSLEVTKINGQVNQYTLNLTYQITPGSDPNYFEKVFSSVSDTRKIVFTYGDLSMPAYVYRDEEAIITQVKTNLATSAAQINYTVSAISSSTLLNAGSFSFPARTARPSEVLYEIIANKKYGVQDIFYGMRNIGLLKQNNVIASDDKIVKISQKVNMSILDYITYLVSCMTPTSDTRSSLAKTGMYVLNVVDDTSGTYQGPYFTVKKLSNTIDNTNALETYTIDIGYPGQDIVTSFSIDDNQNYSIYYNYTNKLSSEDYSYRINNQGKFERVYSPLLSSGNERYKTTEADRSWWTSVTEYPISATLTMKGLLRPALLMNYVRINLWYFGKKHISSGLYVITKQVDKVDTSGFTTTLSLLRVRADDDTLGVIETTAESNQQSNSSSGWQIVNGKKVYKVSNSGVK